MTANASIWEKIDLEEYLATQVTASRSPDADKQAPKTGWAKVRHRAYWVFLKCMAVAFWIYVPLKLLVGDVDRWVLSRVDPNLHWILDYRFFFFLGAFCLALLLFRRWIYLGAFIYVLTFPLLVIGYYVPRLLSRQRTWMPTIGLFNVLWITMRSLRFAVLAATLFAIATLVVVLDAASWLQVTAVYVLLILWAVLLGRACLTALRPVSFIRAQQRLIGRVQKSAFGQSIASPSADYLKPEVVTLSKTQVDALVTHASGAVCLYAAGYFLADQLERYRKSGAAVVFSMLGVGALFLEAIAILTVVNVAIWHVDERQFSYTESPSAATFVRYTLNSLFPGDIDALQPERDWATWVSIYSGISVGIIMLTLVVSLVFSVRSTREDSAATESINKMRQRSDEYAARLVEEYRLPLEQLVSRLIQMSGALDFWFRFVSDRIGEIKKSDLDG